ncbi:O-antigen ligase family protein [Desulfofustis limnaeus]|nr:O-antigen ligase family protein [Desulfofustis limnaeus]
MPLGELDFAVPLVMKNNIYCYILVLPILLRWIFLETWEIRLTVHIFGYPLFLPELLYFLLPLVCPKRRKIHKSLILLALIGIYYLMINCLLKVEPIETAVINFYGGSDLFLFLFIYSLYPLEPKHITIVRWPILLGWTCICLEIFLFSTILSYGGLEHYQRFGEIVRISTTIGAATGSAIVVFILGVILYQSFIDKKIMSIAILAITSLSIAFTLSRGALVAQVLFLFVVILKNFMPISIKKILQTMLAVILISFVIYLVNNRINLYSSMEERFAYGTESGDITSGREDRWKQTIHYVSQNPIFGNGSSFLMPYERGRYLDVKSLNSISPHNSYLLCLVDYGLVGFGILFSVIIYIVILVPRDSYYSLLNLSLIINIIVLMNVEAVYYNAQYFVPFLFLFLFQDTMVKKVKISF